ncbi:MAG: hypothetical protein CME61_06570 [Halobacteriovoraceae bacterium]|nr:hypothetical protein [Halobacteriovoraceae bacterium]
MWFSKEKFPLADPCVINHKDGRVIFFIPHDDLILVGTTEEEVSENFDGLHISEKEKSYLMSIVNHYYPELPLKEEDILSTYSGVRPLIRESGNNEKGKTARTHRTYQFEETAFAIMGGKYTTFRVMAQESVKSICHKLNIIYKKNKTLSPLRQKSISLGDSFSPPIGDELIRLIEIEHPRTLEDLIHRRLGLYSKKHWSLRYKDYDFQQFIRDNSNVLKNHLELGTEDPTEYFK